MEMFHGQGHYQFGGAVGSISGWPSVQVTMGRMGNYAVIVIDFNN